MKAFLWVDVNELTENYHSEGSVLVQAETLERARTLVTFERTTWGSWLKNEPSTTETITVKLPDVPDAIFESAATEEKVWVFPNAGCC